MYSVAMRPIGAKPSMNNVVWYDGHSSFPESRFHIIDRRIGYVLTQKGRNMPTMVINGIPKPN